MELAIIHALIAADAIVICDRGPTRKVVNGTKLLAQALRLCSSRMITGPTAGAADEASLRQVRIVLAEPDFKVVAQAGDIPSTRSCLREHAPDVLVLDLNMPGESPNCSDCRPARTGA